MKKTTNLLVLSVALVLVSTGLFAQKNNAKPVYAHTLVFYLKPDLSKKEVVDFQNFFEGLAKLPYQKNLRYGMPAASTPRPVLDQSFTYSATMEFKSLEDLEAYGKLPEHLALVAQYKPYFQSMKVYDTVLNVKNK